MVGAWAIAIVLTYWLLAIAARCRRPQQATPPALTPRSRFRVVIPAHNEATCIGDTVRSSRSVDYPKELFEVVVIADNCTDGTAAIARGCGVRCLERVDPVRRGKGYALAFARKMLEKEDFDCLVIIDADCSVDQAALRVFDQHLQAGDEVLQAEIAATNVDASAISYVLGVGNTIENQMFWVGKEACGLFVMVQGTGMAIHRRVIERVPWRAFSVVEDVEFSLALAVQGIRVRFLPQVRVQSPVPASGRELLVQRQRWAGGTAALTRTRVARLLWLGVVRRDPLILDAGWTCMLLSLPLVVAIALLGASVSIVGMTLGAAKVGRVGVGLAALAAIGLGGYLIAGVVRTGMSRSRARLLRKVPCVLGELIRIAVQAAITRRRLDWVRTPRDG